MKGINIFFQSLVFVLDNFLQIPLYEIESEDQKKKKNWLANHKFQSQLEILENHSFVKNDKNYLFSN